VPDSLTEVTESLTVLLDLFRVNTLSFQRFACDYQLVTNKYRDMVWYGNTLQGVTYYMPLLLSLFSCSGVTNWRFLLGFFLQSIAVHELAPCPWTEQTTEQKTVRPEHGNAHLFRSLLFSWFVANVLRLA